MSRDARPVDFDSFHTNTTSDKSCVRTSSGVPRCSRNVGFDWPSTCLVLGLPATATQNGLVEPSINSSTMLPSLPQPGVPSGSAFGASQRDISSSASRTPDLGYAQIRWIDSSNLSCKVTALRPDRMGALE